MFILNSGHTQLEQKSTIRYLILDSSQQMQQATVLAAIRTSIAYKSLYSL